MKITSVLIVKEIEPSLPFWVERMGFRNVAEVPEGGRLGFVMLERDGVELMLQSIESVRKDAPQFAPHTPPVCSLFIEVDDFADVLKRLAGYPIALEERTTFYGMREIAVFEPSGHIVMFAVKV
jgi:catechol 2,3-dioxygenase-like lactoylglutathione lyase family enzyme